MSLRCWVLLVVVVAVGSPVVASAGEEEYYAGANLKAVPIRLTDRLQKADAELRAAYYIGVRDDQGRLVRVTKRLNGKLFFEREYVYDARGVLTEVRATNSKGVKKTFRRNEDGTYR